MKNNFLIKLSLASVVVGLCVFTGCKKEEGTVGDAGAKVSAIDTSEAEKQLASAPPDVQPDISQAFSSIRSGDYSSAIAKFQKVAENAQLTPEHKKAINDVIAKVQKAVTDNASKAVEGAEKAVEDVKKALPQ